MTHIIAVVHGIAAALACAVVFYVAGLALAGRRVGAPAEAVSLPVVGAAAYVAACWIAVTAWHVRVTEIAAAFVALATSLAVVRFRALKPVITTHIVHRTFATSALLYAAFYIIAYLLIRPPAGELLLPEASTGQINLVTYARYARNLISWGSPDLAAAPFDFSRSPAVPVLLGALSVFYHVDPLHAALPLQFAAVALAGAAAFSISRSLFRLSPIASVTIACILLTSASMSDVTVPYRVETAIVIPLALYLIWAAAKTRPDAGAAALVFTFVPGYALVLLTETAAAPGIVALQGLVISVRIVASRSPAPLAFVGLGVMGVVLLGVAHGIQSAGLVLAILMMGAVAYAVFNSRWPMRLFSSAADQKLVLALTVYVAIALIVGNVATHAFAPKGAVLRVPGAWQNVERLNERPLRDLTLKLARHPGEIAAELVRYYLPETDVHVIPATAELPDFGTISRQTPLLIQNFGCEGVGHDDTVAVQEVGCLLFAPPSVALDTSYPFYRTFLAIDFANMSSREAGGRRSTRRPLRLTLAADPERTHVDRRLHVNLLVDPLLPDGVPRQRLAVTWGANRTGAVEVGDAGWVSIPVTSGDWSGNRVWTLPIAIHFPDRRTMLFQELSLSEIARGALVR